MKTLDPYNARSLATRHHIDLTKDFYVLSSFEVGQVLDAADEYRYRKPKNANGSRGRYFFEFLKRTANRKTP